MQFGKQLRLVAASASLLVCAASGFAQVNPGWGAYGGNPQHTALSTTQGQRPKAVRWSTPVDLAPPYSGNELFIHYGTPLCTKKGNIVVPVRTNANSNFRVEVRKSANGALIWQADTQYSLPSAGWIPSFGCAILSDGRLAYPNAGGTVTIRTSPDSATGASTTVAFYGTSLYNADKATYDANVKISTPLVTDTKGNIYFGFQATGATTANLVSGIARISSTGVGTWKSAADASGWSNMAKVVFNCAPALSNDGKQLYFAVNHVNYATFGIGFLVSVDSTTLTNIASAHLKDPKSGNDALLPDDGTASPTVGPDGDVYFGILENPFPGNHARGWLLHYSGDLQTQKASGAFGWDDTASVVPATAVPSYTGKSTYLLLTKYNNYVEGGGDGSNKVAILDPNDTQTDSVSGATVMKEILVRTGPTPDTRFGAGYPNAVREWCINTAAVDAANKCAFVNNEDGVLYRWDFVTNTLTHAVTLTAGIGEAYTPTIIGTDGTVYAINNALLFAVGVYQPKLTIKTSSALMGSPITFVANFTRNGDGANVEGKSVAFTLDGVSVGKALTDAMGNAQLVYNPPSTFLAGNHTLAVSYAGDADYSSAASSRVIPIRYQTALALPSVTGGRGMSVNLQATVTRTLDGFKVGGQVVTFKVAGVIVGTATTNTGGVATFSYAIPATATVGKVTISASSAGDVVNTPSSASAKLTIQ